GGRDGRRGRTAAARLPACLESGARESDESSVLYRCGATQRAAVVMRLAIMGSGAPVQRWMPEAGREGPAAESTAGRHGATAHHSTETRGAGRGLDMTTIKVCAWH